MHLKIFWQNNDEEEERQSSLLSAMIYLISNSIEMEGMFNDPDWFIVTKEMCVMLIVNYIVILFFTHAVPSVTTKK